MRLFFKYETLYFEKFYYTLNKNRSDNMYFRMKSSNLKNQKLSLFFFDTRRPISRVIIPDLIFLNSAMA